MYELFLDIINDFSFCQMVTEPTCKENILDLCLTTNHTLIDKISCQPGLSDHDMATVEGSVKPTLVKSKPRKVHLLRKADWTRLKSLMKSFQVQFLLDHAGKSVEDLWSSFIDALNRYMNECITAKLVRGKSSLAWVTQDIKRLI